MTPREKELGMTLSVRFRQALGQICGREVPTWALYPCVDANYERTTDWLGEERLPDAVRWSTHLGMIEAAELMVREAVSNANINKDGIER